MLLGLWLIASGHPVSTVKRELKSINWLATCAADPSILEIRPTGSPSRQPVYS
jgi:hypothetical protein